jgi:hypothetical protein
LVLWWRLLHNTASLCSTPANATAPRQNLPACRAEIAKIRRFNLAHRLLRHPLTQA